MSSTVPALVETASNKCFNGLQKIFSHQSSELKCNMNFGIFLPAEALEGTKLPVLYFLSGLTCTEANFIQKSGFQRYAAEHKMIVVTPDTSPRGCNIPGEADSWDFGVGAGFYVDATEEKWRSNFRMFSYVTQELPQLVAQNFPVLAEKQGISGHSMGGHGALICALKTGLYRSVSAFAPICNPIECPWGKKAFGGYFGDANKDLWQQFDATCLIEHYKGPHLDILIDQGDKDQFLKEKQLLPDNFQRACEAARVAGAPVSLQMRLQEGYDHSYFFIATFLEQHFKHHAKLLNAA